MLHQLSSNPRNFRFLETEISEDRLLVIDQESDNPVPIDILFQVNPTALRIAGICLNIANAPKCEIYTGNCLEYHSVDVGTKQDDMPELDVFKYELNFSQRLPSVISLKVRRFFKRHWEQPLKPFSPSSSSPQAQRCSFSALTSLSVQQRTRGHRIRPALTSATWKRSWLSRIWGSLRQLRDAKSS